MVEQRYERVNGNIFIFIVEDSRLNLSYGVGLLQTDMFVYYMFTMLIIPSRPSSQLATKVHSL